MCHLTILTLCTDESSYIDEALASVPETEPGLVEHLIVHDGSENFAKDLSRRYPHLSIISGKGEGAAAAGVLGIAHAKGAFLLQMNSDDRICAEGLFEFLRASTTRPEIDVWTGALRIFKREPGGPESIVARYRPEESQVNLLEPVLYGMPAMTSRFIRRDVFSRIGSWNLRYPNSVDREFAIRLVLNRIQMGCLRHTVSEMRMHEQSETILARRTKLPPFLKEHVVMAREYCKFPGTSDEERKILRRWHAGEVTRFSYYSLKHLRVPGLIGNLVRALVWDAAMPFRVLSALRRIKAARNPPCGTNQAARERE